MFCKVIFTCSSGDWALPRSTMTERVVTRLVGMAATQRLLLMRLRGQQVLQRPAIAFREGYRRALRPDAAGQGGDDRHAAADGDIQQAHGIGREVDGQERISGFAKHIFALDLQ